MIMENEDTSLMLKRYNKYRANLSKSQGRYYKTVKDTDKYKERRRQYLIDNKEAIRAQKKQYRANKKAQIEASKVVLNMVVNKAINDKDEKPNAVELDDK